MPQLLGLESQPHDFDMLLKIGVADRGRNSGVDDMKLIRYPALAFPPVLATAPSRTRVAGAGSQLDSQDSRVSRLSRLRVRAGQRLKAQRISAYAFVLEAISCSKRVV